MLSKRKIRRHEKHKKERRNQPTKENKATRERKFNTKPGNWLAHTWVQKRKTATQKTKPKTTASWGFLIFSPAFFFSSLKIQNVLGFWPEFCLCFWTHDVTIFVTLSTPPPLSSSSSRAIIRFHVLKRYVAPVAEHHWIGYHLKLVLAKERPKKKKTKERQEKQRLKTNQSRYHLQSVLAKWNSKKKITKGREKNKDWKRYNVINVIQNEGEITTSSLFWKQRKKKKKEGKKKTQQTETNWLPP